MKDMKVTPPQSNDPLAFYKAFERFDDPNIRILKVRKRGKEAVERNWQTTKNYKFNSPEILTWIRSGGNYAITSPFGFYVSIDADSLEIQEALEKNLPKTLRWSTGRVGHYQYGYFLEDSPVGCIPLRDGAYIKGRGGYALGPGSIHPNGVVYGSREVRDAPIAIVKKQELLNAVGTFIEGNENITQKPSGELQKGNGEILLVLKKYNVDVAKFRRTGEWLRGSHPVHGSTTGSNFEINPNTNGWHCFRHNTGGGVISLIAVLEKMIECKDVGNTLEGNK